MASDLGGRLWDLIEHELGLNDHNMRRDRPYAGQPHTFVGTRGAVEVLGITFRDLRDAFIRAVLLATGGQSDGEVGVMLRYREAEKGENAVLCSNDLYGFNLDRLDPMAICQNLCVEVEKLMGVYPNVEGNSPDSTESLHTFLDVAAGEGLVLGGVDAADLYQQIFPARFAAAIARVEEIDQSRRSINRED